MVGYSHAVMLAIAKEMKKMFVTYKALKFVHQADIPPDAIYYIFFLFLKLKFLPDHTFERMAARLCAMEQNASSMELLAAPSPMPPLAITISSSSLSTPSSPTPSRTGTCPSSSYDVPGAFLQCKLTPQN